MSRDFIGSKIAIITKSQIRYVGTIIGIDAQTSSILLGNVKCFGTENRAGPLTNANVTNTILPIMQFANSDIEDLKIVDEEQTPESPQQKPSLVAATSSTLVPTASQQSSIHDDPAILSAVVSSTYKDNASNSSISSRLTQNLQQMTLSDEKQKLQAKNEESRMRADSGELGPSWSLLSQSTWENNNSKPKPTSQQPSENKSKFFDSFISDNNNNNNNTNTNTNRFQPNRPHQRISNTHSTQTFRENGGRYNGQQDDNELPVRQPFFADDSPYPQRQQQQSNRYQNDSIQPNRYQNDSIQPNRYQNDSIQPNRYQNDSIQPSRFQNDSIQSNRYQNDSIQSNRYQNDNMQNKQRYFHNNYRLQKPHQQRYPGSHGGGNRETFQGNPDDYDDEFDFETSNQKFNKLTSDDELKPQNDFTRNHPAQLQIDNDLMSVHPTVYDKKKSFFDNLAPTEQSDASALHGYNRSRNKDTFNHDGYQHHNNRFNGNGNGYRRSNNNHRQNQYGNEDFSYKQHSSNKNGYNYQY
ncbi:unnamed protein product [Rotaria socialis]|uniref:DFDF domain-containing protein n=1 Tax=Rotaria socialis TaxID=392032 RepID=A0A817TTE5_9BILA|nr:unnamed protein product [Rotaria socialis]CAF4477783.1 unnamed protein product [Rotaria socialis]